MFYKMLNMHSAPEITGTPMPFIKKKKETPTLGWGSYEEKNRKGHSMWSNIKKILKKAGLC